MVITKCWSCGKTLRVSKDPKARKKETAGENTIDPSIRVCVRCWREIKRNDVSRMTIEL